MKRLLFALLLIPSLAQAQNERENAYSSKAIRQFGLGLTANSLFGLPRYPTASLPTCDAFGVGAVAYDTTTSSIKVCSGASWGAVGGIAFGNASGGTATRVLFSDGTGLLADDADLTFVTDTLTATKIGSTTFTGTNLSTGRHTFGTAADAASAIDFGVTAACITFEGAAADTAEACLTHTVNAGFDTTTTFPALGAAQTVAMANQSQTFTGMQTFGAMVLGADSFINAALLFHIGGTSGNTVGAFRHSTNVSPAGFELFTGTTSESIRIRQKADIATDGNNGACGTTACTHPSLTILSASSGVNDYATHSYAGSASKSVKALTESAATSTVRIALAAEAGTGGTYHYSIYATDGSTPQIRQGRVIFSVTNDGGTETCVLGTPEETDNTPTGTLTVTVTCDTTPTNAVDFQLNAVSSLTQTSLDAYSHVTLVGSGELQPQ